MKKFISVIFLTLLISLFGCTDLTGVKNRLDDHEKRLSALEELVSKANSSIKGLQKLLDAEAKKLSIVSFEESKEGGYVLHMSNGSTITLKNGKDGTSPNVGVQEDEGVLYWTINGDFMRDADGNKIKAEGTDGISGVTPQIRVDAEGYWEVSIDSGKTWQALLDANGNKVKAIGSDATVDFEITEDDNSVIIKYDGKTFVIPKNGSEPTPNPVERPFLSIDYVPEYNMSQDGKTFASSNASNASGYFNWNDAMALFGKDKKFEINGQEYHLPSVEEWIGIVPEWNSGKNISFESPSEVLGFVENVSIGGAATVEYKSDYKSFGDKISYGLRFKNSSNEQLSAWRYALVKDPTEGLRLEITVRYLGPKQRAISIDEIANQDWWEKDASGDIRRVIPCSGIKRGGSSITGLNEYGDYWLSKEANATTAWNMYIYSGSAFSGYSYSGKDFGFTIRLISSKPISSQVNPQPEPKTRPKLPIDYVAEYNVNKSGDGFTQDLSASSSGLFTWDKSRSLFSTEFLKNYHLPTKKEWLGIISEYTYPTRFDFVSSYDDVEETIEFAGVESKYFADYRSFSKGKAYAIKLKSADNKLRSAYMYEVKNLGSNSENGQLVITVRYLGPDAPETINDIVSEDWWSKNSQDDIIRIFPASGRLVSGSISNLGRRGYYWSDTKYDDSTCWVAHFDATGVDVNCQSNSNGRSIRPFINK